jgi:mono/diheme cytochrome c family protein
LPIRAKLFGGVSEKTLKRLTLLCLAMAAAACQPLPPATSAPPAESLAFAQGACGGCHAVARYDASPNPDAPPFARIVNQEGLTAETLSFWLREAHNYPEEMDFYLEAKEVDDLVAYMLTLQDPDYRPPI